MGESAIRCTDAVNYNIKVLNVIVSPKRSEKRPLLLCKLLWLTFADCVGQELSVVSSLLDLKIKKPS